MNERTNQRRTKRHSAKSKARELEFSSIKAPEGCGVDGDGDGDGDGDDDVGGTGAVRRGARETGNRENDADVVPPR